MQQPLLFCISVYSGIAEVVVVVCPFKIMGVVIVVVEVGGLLVVLEGVGFSIKG